MERPQKDGIKYLNSTHNVLVRARKQHRALSARLAEFLLSI